MHASSGGNLVGLGGIAAQVRAHQWRIQKRQNHSSQLSSLYSRLRLQLIQVADRGRESRAATCLPGAIPLKKFF